MYLCVCVQESHLQQLPNLDRACALHLSYRAMNNSTDARLTLSEITTGVAADDHPELWAKCKSLTLEIGRASTDALASEVDFAPFTALESLHVNYRGGVNFLPSLTLRGQSITFLHLSGSIKKPSDFASILSDQQLPTLEEVVLESLDPSHEKEGGMVRNNTVQRLVLIGNNSPLALTQVTMGSLQFLRLAGVRYFDKKHRQNALEDFVQRSSSNLQVISMEDSKLNSPEIAKLMGKAPSVQTLYVPNCSFFHQVGSARRVPLASLSTINCMQPMFPYDKQDGLCRVMTTFFRTRGSYYGNVSIKTPAPHRCNTEAEMKIYAEHVENLSTVGAKVQEVSSSELTPSYTVHVHSYDPTSFTRLSAWGEYPDRDDDYYYDSDDCGFGDRYYYSD
ncbi:hypothetical protein BKA70DRAFT_1332525 [Coprinopsis sp. MPI-PUGE-AT-0042]|nr:hypothetical protein BKA70DRAFT_1332525 [Coprinopsis sp. MPI-PUGE-AT-0042]